MIDSRKNRSAKQLNAFIGILAAICLFLVLLILAFRVTQNYYAEIAATTLLCGVFPPSIGLTALGLAHGSAWNRAGQLAIMGAFCIAGGALQFEDSFIGSAIPFSCWSSVFIGLALRDRGHSSAPRSDNGNTRASARLQWGILDLFAFVTLVLLSVYCISRNRGFTWRSEMLNCERFVTLVITANVCSIVIFVAISWSRWIAFATTLLALFWQAVLWILSCFGPIVAASALSAIVVLIAVAIVRPIEILDPRPVQK